MNIRSQGLRLVGILLTLLIGTVGFAGTGSADPYAEAPFASAASLTGSYVQDAEGNEALIFLFVRRTTDSTTLFTRICDWPVQLCRELVQQIPEADYQLDAFNARGRLRTSVAGLGTVRVDIYSVGDSTLSMTCPDLVATRSFATFLGEMAAEAGGAYGGQIGPWFIISGFCGINGRNVQVLTTSV